MMPRFFVESKKADRKFLQDFIEERFGKIIAENNFIELGSWSGYKKEIQAYNISQESFTNITIIDADLNHVQRRQEVTADFNDLNINSELFLFPNNNSNGNLEDVLSSITVRHDLIDCFQQYEQCVNHYPQKLNHSRIYSYLDMILYPNAIVNGKDLRKEEFRNYRNHTHWNLHHEYLDPLYSFLSPYFQAQ